MVVFSAMGLELRRELVDQVAVRSRVDLALRILERRAHRDLRHVAAQRFPRLRGRQGDLLLRRGN